MKQKNKILTSGGMDDGTQYYEKQKGEYPQTINED